ncbi:MAG: hypothetical protein ACRDDW_00015 [Candidatus Rhabdochlamydia sp.]
MLGITNFNPIQSINSFLRPLGLAISSKEQIIAKTTMAAFAALTLLQVTDVLGKGTYRTKHLLHNLTFDGINYFIMNRTLILVSGVCTEYCHNNQFYESCLKSCIDRSPCTDYCWNNPDYRSYESCIRDCRIVGTDMDHCLNETDYDAYTNCLYKDATVDYP